MGAKHLLVIETLTSQVNWYEIFKGCTIQGQEIVVEQAAYDEIAIVSYDDGQTLCSLRRSRNPLPNTPQEKERTFRVDFVLQRSVTHALDGQDSKNTLYGFLHGNIPAVNTFHSALMCLERPVVFAELKKIQDKLGKKAFPLIDQTYYGNWRNVVITPDPPFVVKSGHAHAGYGKARCDSRREFEDVKSILALHKDYVTIEPFVEWDYDLRIQKIGQTYRVFKRVSATGSWKGNVGSAILEEIPLTPEFKLWVDEACQMFGGLDICALDAIHSKADGSHAILELNDTAIGLMNSIADQDRMVMRDLVLQRMEEHFSAKTKPTAAEGEAEASSSQVAIDVGQSKDLELSQAKQKIAQLELELSNLKAKRIVQEPADDGSANACCIS